MKQKNQTVLKKYIVCFCVASLITCAVFWVKGFFGSNPAENVQILSDGFFVSGILLTMYAAMMFISGEGALIGIGFILRNAILTFIPMGRAKQETYAQYRERKLGEIKKPGDNCILITGLIFVFIGIVFTVIWSLNFYNVT